MAAIFARFQERGHPVFVKNKLLFAPPFSGGRRLPPPVFFFLASLFLSLSSSEASKEFFDRDGPRLKRCTKARAVRVGDNAANIAKTPLDFSELLQKSF